MSKIGKTMSENSGRANDTTSAQMRERRQTRQPSKMNGEELESNR